MTPSPCSVPQAVLFDMDGLLVDTERLWFDAEAQVARSIGGSWTHEQQNQVKGSRIDNVAAAINATSQTPAPVEVIVKALLTGIVEAAHTQHVEWLPGAFELLAAVHAARIPTALVTSSSTEFVQAVMESLSTQLESPVANMFTTIVTGDHISASKPDPEGFLTAAHQLQVDAATCVVLEDSPNGIAAGLAAGCQVVAVPSCPKEQLLPRTHNNPRCHIYHSLTVVTLDKLQALSQ